MTIDLKSMTKKELEKLAQNVERQLERLKKQDLKKARDAAEKAAAAHGFKLSDIVGGGAAPATKPRKAKPKAAGVAKYANPADSGQTWTGKGRQPKWFKDALAAGKSPESMEL